MYFEVTSDLFDIVGRLKFVNSQFRVFWNGGRERYEVHRTERPAAITCEFVVPNNVLDERVIIHAQKTRIENRYDIEDEVDAHNRLIERSADAALEKELEGMASRMAFANRMGRRVDFLKVEDWL